jgi:hypothetical protein
MLCALLADDETIDRMSGDSPGRDQEEGWPNDFRTRDNPVIQDFLAKFVAWCATSAFFEFEY